MPGLRVRWSEREARKPYARPFGVSFLAADGSIAGMVAMTGADLLYYRQFQGAVLSLGGELFRHPLVDAAADPQTAWLDELDRLLPRAEQVRLTPVSSFRQDDGRVFGFELRLNEVVVAVLDPAPVLEYQEFQAAVAHQTGRLFRDLDVEALADSRAAQGAWMDNVDRWLERPASVEAMAETWPWR